MSKLVDIIICRNIPGPEVVVWRNRVARVKGIRSLFKAETYDHAVIMPHHCTFQRGYMSLRRLCSYIADTCRHRIYV